jgi:hypothetical protein
MRISACTSGAIDPHVYQTFNNTLYSPKMAFSEAPCSSFADWQSTGQDHGSTVNEMLSEADIVALGKGQLPWASGTGVGHGAPAKNSERTIQVEGASDGDGSGGTHIPSVLALANAVLT